MEEVFIKSVLPDEYKGLENTELERRISERKEHLNEQVIILGHHYQRKEIIKYSD